MINFGELWSFCKPLVWNLERCSWYYTSSIVGNKTFLERQNMLEKEPLRFTHSASGVPWWLPAGDFCLYGTLPIVWVKMLVHFPHITSCSTASYVAFLYVAVGWHPSFIYIYIIYSFIIIIMNNVWLCTQVMVTNVTSLLKTVKAVEDEHTRGTRALESTIEAIAQEIRVSRLV